MEETILKKILEALSDLKEGQKEIKAEVTGISKKLDIVYNHTANLTEEAQLLKAGVKEIKEIKAEVEEIKRNLSTVETVTANNYLDVSNLKAVFRK